MGVMMRTKRSFRPSEQWNLEDRIALSTASVAAEVLSASAAVIPTTGLKANFSGRYTTLASTGIGGGEKALLSGSANIAKVGRLTIAGDLSSNPALAPPSSNTKGTLIVTSKTRPGTVVLALSGAPSDLSPQARTTTVLSFTVKSATGQLAPLSGIHGTAILTLAPKHGGIPHGQFKLRLVQS